MLEKLQQNTESIPPPSRDEMMKMFDASRTKVSISKYNVLFLKKS